MIRLVTYSDHNMTISRKKCIESAMKYGVEQVHEWNREMLEATEFYQLNREILDQPRGSGYWLWKPYIIYKAMFDMHEGDILVYSDAGVQFINSVHHIINVMNQDLFLFGNNWNHVDWCKGGVLEKIFGNSNEWHDISDWDALPVEKQVQASVIFIRVSKASKEFIKEWLMYCQLPNLIDDTPSKFHNAITFAEHRHDQAILTCLAYKYFYKLHWWPASYTNGGFVYDKIEQYKEDNYPVIFNHHRRRNSDY